jgi:hypothetical protein
MIASTSTLWQDKKHSLKITYATPTEGGELKEITSWYVDGEDKETTTTGNSKQVLVEGSSVFVWRGTGWLKWFSTRWEIVGLGELEEGEGNMVLVNFVQKTLISPAALSVLVRRKRVDDEMDEKVLEEVVMKLRALGCEALDAEVEKLKVIPR